MINWPSVINSLKSAFQPTNDTNESPTYAGSRKLGARLADEYFKMLANATTIPSMAKYIGPTSAPPTVKLTFEDAMAELTGPDYARDNPLEKRLQFKPAPSLPDPKSMPNPEEEFKAEMRRGDSSKYVSIAGSTGPITFKYYEVGGEDSEMIFAEVPNLPGTSAPYDPNTYNLLSVDQINALANIVSYRNPGSTVRDSLKEYYDELDTWKTIKRAWTEAKVDSLRQVQQPQQGGDPYDKMAQSLIAWWTAQGALSFSPAPASFPATIPSPGTYNVIFPGNQVTLARGLRTSMNAGMIFASINPKSPNIQDTALTIMATAFAATFALHLLEIKMLYNGALPPSIPVIGLVAAIV